MADDTPDSDRDLIRAERVVPAPAKAIFDLLARPASHRIFDGSGTVGEPLAGQPERLSLGDRFGMKMKLGVPYRITSKVIEFEEDRLIAWQHPGRHIWRYRLEPVGGDRPATMVVEEFDLRPSPLAWVLRACRVPQRNARAMTATLHRLVEHFT